MANITVMRFLNFFLAVSVISLILILTTLPPEFSSNKMKQFYFTEKIKIVPQIEEAIENRTKSEIESLKLKIDSLQSELSESKHIQTAVQKEKLTADVKITQLLGVQNEQADLLKLRDERIQVLLNASDQLDKKMFTTKASPTDFIRPEQILEPARQPLIAFQPHQPGKILFHLHFHKAAGSTVCQLANSNKYKTTVTNCNYWKNQTCCGETIDQQQSVAKTIKKLYNFVANERYLPAELDHEYFEYMVVFRRPMERYASHYKYARDGYYSEKFMGKFDSWLECQPDNYMLRNLCGLRCLDKPRGTLNRDDLEYAKNKLDGFKAVLILEDFADSMEIMKIKFGWNVLKYEKNNTVIKKHDKRHWNTYKKSQDLRSKHLKRLNSTIIRRSSLGNQGKSHDEKVYSDVDLKKFSFMTTFDDELYAYAQYLSIAQRETVKNRELYAKLEQECVSECCCEKCSVYR